jgi:hypothetical protein
MIEYASTGKVGVSAAGKIQEEAGAIRRPWWRGALGFDADRSDGPVILSGRTPLFHAGGIPDEDDLVMAFADASFIVAQLAAWAKRFRIKWRLRMNGEDWGAIDATGLTRPLLNQMVKWARRAGAVECEKGVWAVPGERLEELSRRHQGRRGDGSG